MWAGCRLARISEDKFHAKGEAHGSVQQRACMVDTLGREFALVLTAVIEKIGDPLRDTGGLDLYEYYASQVRQDKALVARAIFLQGFCAASERFAISQVVIQQLRNSNYAILLTADAGIRPGLSEASTVPLTWVPGQVPEEPRKLYIELVKRCVANLIYRDDGSIPGCGDEPFALDRRSSGTDWPARAHTMIGLRRLDNIQACLEDAIGRGVPGDVMETGVWRGGAVIFMRAILAAHGIRNRTVWAADSFAGLPPPDPVVFPADEGLDLSAMQNLRVSLEEVKENFSAYGLLDEQVRFVQGWFRETLPTCEVQRLALLRLDGDLYESTWVALESLYPRVSPGGFVIVDDYGAIEQCRRATDDYREAHDVGTALAAIDWTGVFWKKA